jgi:ABC-2 type transport system permease protein
MPIFDQGYQHWSGALTGHAWRWLAITRRGVQVGKSGRPLRIVLILAWLPAIALALVLCLWGLLERQSDLIESLKPMFQQFLGAEMLTDPREFRVEFWTLAYHFFLGTETMFAMLLVFIVGPTLISQDLRYNALPLYFSRPLRRIDYFLGKLGVIVAFLGMVIIVPSVMAYALGLLFSLDLTIIRDTFGILLASVVYGLVLAVSAGTLMLALSCLSRNSRYVALFWLAVWIGTSAVAGVLNGVAREQRMREAWQTGGFNSPDFAARELDASKTNWRQLPSYSANLAKVGQALLGTNKAWERLADLQPFGRREQFLLQMAGPQFPWPWSAAVLSGIFGLSACILHFSIKSLDRLK